MMEKERVSPGKRHGFTLGEMLLALLISSGIFLGAARFFPHLVRNNWRLQQQTLLAQEVHELLLMLEKTSGVRDTAKGHPAPVRR